MATTQHHPYHPIIYVRGFAATQTEIEETVADPYMGFNIGSTKARTAWTGDVKRFYFESPLVRLMSDHKYEDVFVDGDDLVAAENADQPVPYRCIVIYRYYDEASKDFGDGKTPPIESFARGLNSLILRLRERICANKDNHVTPEDFRVHLVAHSMGGLVCRAFLQNPDLGSDDARRAVDKLFTYATPHNGIDMRIVRNVPVNALRRIWINSCLIGKSVEIFSTGCRWRTTTGFIEGFYLVQDFGSTWQGAVVLGVQKNYVPVDYFQ
jgi:triacylglycerol esterase/lipase EstA (alpha/beta hydrolase family)